MTILFLSIILFVITNSLAINVKNASELKAALSSAKAGDNIVLADGTYEGQFQSSKSGSASSPITLEGSNKAILTSASSGYGLHLQGSYWVLKGFTVTRCQKGIVLDGANHNLLENLDVSHIDDEGVHFRQDSSDNTIQSSTISNTGLKQPGYGEGLYMGSAVSNWVNGKPDKSDRNKALNNHFGPNIAAEAIDVKEGSEGGLIDGNTFDGTGMKGENGAFQWVDVKGDGYTISNNKGSKSLRDGFHVQHIAAANVGGCNNKFIHNTCSGLGSGGICVNTSGSKSCTNSVTN